MFKAGEPPLEERQDAHGGLAGIQHHLRNGTRAHRVEDMPRLRAVEPQHILSQGGMVVDLHIAAVALGQRAFLHALTQQLGEGVEALLAPQRIKLHGKMVPAETVAPFLQRLLHTGHVHAAHAEAQRHGLVFTLHAACGFTAAGQRQPRAARAIDKGAGSIAQQARSGVDHHRFHLPALQLCAHKLCAVEHLHAVSGAHLLKMQLGHLRAGEVRVPRAPFPLHAALQFIRKGAVSRQLRHMIGHARHGQRQRGRSAQRIFTFQNDHARTFTRRRAGRHHARRAAACNDHIIGLIHRLVIDCKLRHFPFHLSYQNPYLL